MPTTSAQPERGCRLSCSPGEADQLLNPQPGVEQQRDHRVNDRPGALGFPLQPATLDVGETLGASGCSAKSTRCRVGLYASRSVSAAQA
ncbi:MAG: hypothetical protein ACR2IK_22505 [Chloroflexota bacterium]